VKILTRAERAGIGLPVSDPGVLDDLAPDQESLGALLLAVVAAAGRRGLDPEAALRSAALAQADFVRRAESVRHADAERDVDAAQQDEPKQ
jgi:hypothetical protein